MALSKYSHCNAKDVLNNYKNNKCRLCREMFCCPNCRLQHEGSTHEVNVECLLCIYGFTVMSQIDSDDLTKHIVTKHLQPISRCAYCETVISADTVLNHGNSRCTLTNLTDEEIKQVWSKLPEDVREEILLPCHSNNVQDDAKNIVKNETDTAIVGNTDAEPVHYESPALCPPTRQQLFDLGGFTNSTPVLGSPTPANMESVEVQVKPNNLSANNNNAEIVIDANKKRKVQFDVTPQPVINKTPSSFRGTIQKSSFKKLNNTTDNTSGTNIEIVEPSQHNEPQIVDKCDVENKQSVPKEKITIPVKPIQRDVQSPSSNMEIVNQLSFSGSEDYGWTTAVENLSEFIDVERSRSSNTMKANDIFISDINIVRDIDLQPQLPSSKADKLKYTEGKRYDSMNTARTFWTKCKSTLFGFTRTSVKRLRSELDISLDEREEFSTPTNESKRRRFLECRRPIHYHIKPEVNRDVKKINKGMQTSPQ